MNDIYSKPPPEVAAADKYWTDRRNAEAEYYAKMYDPLYGKVKTTQPTVPGYPA